MISEQNEKEIRCIIQTSLQLLSITHSSDELSVDDVYNYTQRQFPSITRDEIEEVFIKDYSITKHDGEIYINM